MTYHIKCPSCSKHLYFPSVGDKEDFLEGICRNCHSKYALQKTEVESFFSSVEAKPSAISTETISYRRVYNLRLQQANGTLKSLLFSTPGQSEKISGLAGDTILLLYTMCGKQLEDLVWIENSTTGKSRLLLKPGAKARSTGFATAALSLVGSTLLAGFLQIPANQLFWAAAIPSSIGVGVYASKSSSLKVRDSVELGQLSSQQYLLAQKHELEHKITNLAQELQINRKLIQRLQALQQKMIGIEEEQYTSQAEAVARAITILEKQLDLTLNLINGYSHLAEIIQIEYETLHLAEQLPEDVLPKMLKQLEELKAVESAKDELSQLVNSWQLLGEFHPEQNSRSKKQ